MPTHTDWPATRGIAAGVAVDKYDRALLTERELLLALLISAGVPERDAVEILIAFRMQVLASVHDAQGSGASTTPEGSK